MKATIAVHPRSVAICTAARQTVAGTSSAPTAGGGGAARYGVASASRAIRAMVATASTGYWPMAVSWESITASVPS